MARRGRAELCHVPSLRRHGTITSDQCPHLAAAVPVPISGDTVPSPHPATGLGWAGVLMMKCSQLQPGSAQCIYTASPAPAATRLLANKIVRGCFSSRTRIPSQPPSHSTHFSRWLDPGPGRHWSRTKCPANTGPRSTTQHSAGRGEPSIPGPSSRPGPSSSCSLALF